MNRPGGLGIIVLAAGESSRLGQPKQLLPFRGSTLLERTVAMAESLDCGPVAVVLGAFADQIRAALGQNGAELVENAHWQEGMGTSLREGLRALLKRDHELHAVLTLLCDQPLVDADSLRALIREFEMRCAGIAAAQYDGALGVPAIFAAEFFPELLALDGSVGARQIIRRHAARTIAVPMPAAAVDVDTAEDVERLKFEDAACPNSGRA